jgi:modification methylase
MSQCKPPDTSIKFSVLEGGGTWMGSQYYPGDGHVTYEHEYIFLFRKEGKRETPKDETKEQSKLTKEERSEWFRSVWTKMTPERQKDHIAMFPVELPRRLIKIYTYVGAIVLDPFLGSGTTSKAAALTGRNSIGYEVNDDFKKLIYNKIVEEKSLFDEDILVEFL